MNALNYFRTLDDGSAHCGPEQDMDCRGANTRAELERQRAKLLRALDTPQFLDPVGTGQSKNRAALAASFWRNGTDEVFSVATNHLKSRGSSCGAGDDDEWAGSCNRTRTLAAHELAD